MFSHALVAYQQALMQFFNKTSETYKTTSKILQNEPHYNFSILKELTQTEKLENEEKNNDAEKNIIDSDQMLFFQDEYKDEEIPSNKNPIEATSNQNNSNLIDIPSDDVQSENLLDQTPKSMVNNSATSNSTDLLGLDDFGDFISAQSFMPSQLLLNELSFNTAMPNSDLQQKIISEEESLQNGKPKNSILELFNKIPLTNKNERDNINSDGSGNSGENHDITKKTPLKSNKEKLGRKDMTAWFQLFSELDPFANLDAIEKKIEGNSNNNNSHAT